MKVMSVVGARPQFVKAAATSRSLRERHEEILVHTGQHYDYQLSGVFFDGLDLPAPDVNLGVGSAPHGAQTARMLEGLEAAVMAHRPDWLLVYGDTNSTLAAALAAAKLSIPIAHVEAGLRSFNREMPEEVNRVLTDHVSALLLCPSETAVRNLAAEGITRNVHLVGDVMLDVLCGAQRRTAERAPTILSGLGLTPKTYLLVTVHRSENTNGGSHLASILEALGALDEPVVFPMHPRARRVLAGAAAAPRSPRVRLIDPVGYLDMVSLIASARLVLTDSGGVQKEAYWLGVPCLTLRAETEWVETVHVGWNTLVGADPDRIVQAVRSVAPPAARPPLYGDGRAAARCVDLLDRVTPTHRGAS
jgi:UDP-GlcNAc3NAcA epimerase